MAEELVSKWASESFFKQFDDAIPNLEKVVDLIAQANAAGRNSEGLMKQAGSLKEFSTAQKDVASAQDKLYAASQKLDDSWRETITLMSSLNGQSKEAVKVRQELVRLDILEQKAADARIKSTRSVTAELKNQATAAKAAQSAIDPTSLKYLSDRLNDLRNGYQRLTQAERENAEIGGVVLKRIQELDAQLKAADATQGRFNRNVGNYNGAVEGFKLQITQIARELPSLASGLSTFAIAIGNNLPYAQEAFVRLREENIKLREEGKPTTSVFKTLASSIFSWQTALIVALTVLPGLIRYLQQGSKAAQEAEKANQKYAQSIKSIAENERVSAQEEIARANVLTTIAADTTQSMKNRLKAVKELQSTYPDRFGNLTKEEILEGNVADALKRTTQELLNKAAAQAAEKRFAAASERVYELTVAQHKALKELDEAQKAEAKQRKDIQDAGYAANQRDGALVERAQATLNKIIKANNAARAEQRSYLEDAKKFAKQAGDTLFNNTKDPKEKKGKKPTDFTNEELKAQADETKALYEQLRIRAQIEADSAKAIADNDTKTQQERLDAYAIYTQKRIEIAGYELSAELDVTQQKLDKIAEIERKDASRRTNEEKRLLLQKDTLLLQQKNIYDQFELAQNKLVADNGQFRVDLTEKYARQAKKNLAEMAAILGNNNFEDGNARQKDIERRNQKLQEAYQLSADFANSLANINSNLTQRRIQEIDDEIAKINEKRDAEIAGIEASALSEEEKQKKIAAVKANADAQEKALDADKRARQRRAAQFEKSITIAEIIAETALATVRALGSKPYTPANIALAAATAAVGAAKLATAIAAPLPAYEHGTRGKAHPGGPAMLFEGNKPELVMEPGKKPWMGRMQGVYELAKGAEVISNRQLKDIARFYTLGLPALIPQQGYQAVDFGQLQEEMKGVKQAIKDKPVAQLNVTGMGMQRLTRQANNITEYIKSFSC